MTVTASGVKVHKYTDEETADERGLSEHDLADLQAEWYGDRADAPSEAYDYSQIADLCWWRLAPVEMAAD